MTGGWLRFVRRLRVKLRVRNKETGVDGLKCVHWNVWSHVTKSSKFGFSQWFLKLSILEKRYNL